MNEVPFFFDRGEARLFGVYHEPGAGTPARTPFVFCHPFGEEKLWAHRVFVSFARELARNGFPVLRFDYMGNGDSSGLFADSSVETALADIAAAIDEVKRRTGAARVALLGLRLGAALAFRAAAARADVQVLVLWAPLVDGGRYLQELLRINLTTQMAVYREIREDRDAMRQSLGSGAVVNVDGYEVTQAMAEQLESLVLAGDPAVPAARTLIVQVERSEAARPARELEALRDRIASAELQVVQEEPFWKEILRFYGSAPNLFASTMTWLGQH